MKSLRSYRFLSYVLALAVITALGVVALVLKTEPATIAVLLGHVVALGTVALGAGAWHDRGVRAELVKAGLGEVAALPSSPAPTSTVPSPPGAT